jgi:hypothetical protein
MARLRLRLGMFAYALSCALNVLVLRRPEDTSAGESTSGRTFWEARYGQHAGHWTWAWAMRAIDALFFWDRDGEKRHCELADLRDYARAKEKVRRFENRPSE